MKFTHITCLTTTLLCLMIPAVEAQLLYNTLGPNGESFLRQTNLDGTNNIPLTIGNLATAAVPKLSNDGRHLAVTAVNPDRPNQISQNVFSFDSETGQTTQITSFVDEIDSRTGASTIHQPVFKAYSPDASHVAIVDFISTNTNLQGSGTTPLVSVYDTETRLPVGGIQLLAQLDGFHLHGQGIDWAPSGNRVVFPGGNPTGDATALKEWNPFTGSLTQVTNPISGSTFGNIFFASDFLPSYSPDGRAIAYFRWLDRIDLSGNRQSSEISLRITSPAGDRPILQFPAGEWPAGLSWSPDGSQLAYGITSQANDGFFRTNTGEPTSSEVHIVNVDGSNPRPFLGEVALFPEWAPIRQPSNSNIDFNGDGSVDVRDLSSANGLFSVGDLVSGVSSNGRQRFDLTGNGVIDGDDLSIWLSQAASVRGFSSPFLPGDTDLNGVVNFPDFLAVSQGFGNGNEWSMGNFDGSADGTQFPDFLALSSNFGSSTAAAVPEPNGLAMLFAGIVLLLRSRRNRTT